MSNPRTEIRLSFCTTCRGRLDHLKLTLPLNLKNNEQTPSVEFVLLNYSSPDGLQKWVKKVLKDHLRSGRVVFYSVEGFHHFHHAHAKNIAHRLARGKIVCNLDADNFTGVGFAEYLILAFGTRKHIILRAPRGLPGAFGRIALRKSDFEAIGGYDERMEFGWGYEDDDLIRRATRSGFKEHLVPMERGFLKVIQHDDRVRTRFNRIKHRGNSRRRHELISWESLKHQELIANRSKPWGAATATRNFSETIVI
jgi:glycosyl transferase family 7 (putative galactosyltransferase)